MVSSSKVEYYGLQLLVRPFPAKPESVGVDRYLFLTSESSDFELRVKNKTGRSIEGKLAIRFAYASNGGTDVLTNHFIVTMKVAPYEEKISYMRETHQFEGQVVVSICSIGQPEKYVGMDDKDVREVAHLRTGDVLCTYKVLDKVTYELETKRFNDLAKSLKDSLTSHINDTIKAKMVEIGFTKEGYDAFKNQQKNLKTDVTKEQANSQAEVQKKRDDSPYIA